MLAPLRLATCLHCVLMRQIPSVCCDSPCGWGNALTSCFSSVFASNTPSVWYALSILSAGDSVCPFGVLGVDDQSQLLLDVFIEFSTCFIGAVVATPL